MEGYRTVVEISEKVIRELNALSATINELYGFVQIDGDNFATPSINVGPCGPFAKAFYELWNEKFSNKANIAFVIIKATGECWHVLIRLPNGLLYDGGIGVHNESNYDKKFMIEDMLEYDATLLENRSYGLDRQYPRYCPNFSAVHVRQIISDSLSKLS